MLPFIIDSRLVCMLPINEKGRQFNFPCDNASMVHDFNKSHQNTRHLFRALHSGDRLLCHNRCASTLASLCCHWFSHSVSPSSSLAQPHDLIFPWHHQNTSPEPTFRRDLDGIFLVREPITSCSRQLLYVMHLWSCSAIWTLAAPSVALT